MELHQGDLHTSILFTLFLYCLVTFCLVLFCLFAFSKNEKHKKNSVSAFSLLVVRYVLPFISLFIMFYLLIHGFIIGRNNTEDFLNHVNGLYDLN